MSDDPNHVPGPFGDTLTIESIRMGKQWLERARPISPSPLRSVSFDEACTLIDEYDALNVKRERIFTIECQPHTLVDAKPIAGRD